MPVENHILNELNTISQTVANIPRLPVFTVPENYFAEFPGKLMEKIRQDAKIEKNTGARWAGKVSEFVSAIKPGDQIIFRSIRAREPDGTARSLNSIPLEIQ